MLLFFKNYSLGELRYLRIRLNKFFPENTKKIDKNSYNEPNTHKKGLVMVKLVIPPPFKNAHFILSTTYFLWKNLKPPFVDNLKNSAHQL